MAEALSVHTLQGWRTISVFEADDICSHYSGKVTHWKEDNGIEHRRITTTGIKGVNEIDIIRSTQKGGDKPTYRIHLVINVGKLTGGSRIAMTVLRKKTAKKFIEAVSLILDDKLHLHKRNRDASDWNFNRIDVGGDYHIGTNREEVLQFHTRQLHKSFFPYNGGNYSMEKWNESLYELHPEKRGESVRASNVSSIFNIYPKVPETRTKHPDWVLTPKEHEDIDDVIRVEEQMRGQALKAFGSTKFSALMDEDATFSIKKKVIDDFVEVFGTGDYVTLNEGKQIIEDSQFSEADKKRMVLLRLQVCNLGYAGAVQWLMNSKGKTEKESISYIRIYRRKIESLGISMIEMSNDDAVVLGTGRVPSLGKIMQEQYRNSKSRKSRGEFASISYDYKYKRYTCDPTLHQADGSKSRVYIAGLKNESRESVEIKIIKRIGENMVKNLKSCGGSKEAQVRCYGYTRKELMDYRTTVNTAKTIGNIDDWIKKIDAILTKLKGEQSHGENIKE